MRLQGNGIQKKCRGCSITGYKPYTFLRAFRFVFVVTFGLHYFRPFKKSVGLSLVVLTKVTANSLCKIRELALVVTTFRHQIGHHASHFLPTVVRILKFRATDVCAK